MSRLNLRLWIAGICLFLAVPWAPAETFIKDPANVIQKRQSRITQEEREAAADRLVAARAAVAEQNKQAAVTQTLTTQPMAMAGMDMPMPMPGDTPDYFGVANWAYSPPLRKFMDTLPRLTEAGINNLDQYIPVAVKDTTTYPDADYYEIALVQHREKMHTDLPPTTVRVYVQIETPVNAETSKHVALTYPDGSPIRDLDGNQVYAVDNPHYMGPMIVAQKDRPVRVKFTNYLPTGEGGKLFIPVDTTVMGAGMGPMELPDGSMEMYTQNRSIIHLHGGRTPWISDGTPHQWITPAGETTSYPRGVSAENVPDMPDPGEGSMTFYYSNQQSARLMFYHDHSFGITRLNVYAGEAAPYLIQDSVEQELVAANLIPDEQIPLVIQDKTFVDAATIMETDPLWQWGSMPGMPMTGDLWMAHVYVPAQNPFDISGTNPYGRWHYGPWFWPPTNNIAHPPVENPLYDPVNAPWQPPYIPGTPHPSMGMESFMDTVIVNGTAFPTLTLEPKAYRFRILNAANDRFFNLQFYVADPNVVTSDGRTLTEVRMVPAIAYPADPTWPQDYEDGNPTWPTDGREGGVPDWTMRGPDWIQIGTEGGFLPMPAVVPNRPVDWNTDATTFNAGNVNSHAMLLGPAERVDVVVDFSAFAGKTLILYNDAPAAFPAPDPRYDYYTGDPNFVDTGGHWGTQAGFGPNTRTIMQIKINANQPAAAFDLAALEAAFTTTDTSDGVFKRGQDPIIVGQTAYNSVYNTTFPSRWPDWGVSRIQDNALTFRTVDGSTVTVPMEPKAIQDEMGEAFDEYGRMSGFMGLEMPSTIAGNQNFMLYPFISPPVEILAPYVTGTPIGTLGDGIQIWKITHNGVDTHPIHFHLYDVQVINRVGWDGMIRLPDKNELGWKETVRVSPLEDTIVALRAVLPTVPFKMPNSVRLIDPTMPEGMPLMGGPGGFVDPSGEPVTVLNHYVNFGWEYMWHCHILSHEEMDMMHSVAVACIPDAPSDLGAILLSGIGGYEVNLSWTDNALNESGFIIERASDANFMDVTSFPVGMNVTTYTDPIGSDPVAYFYRVVAVNTVGDTEVYPDPAIGFPTKTSVSSPSNTATAATASLPSAPTAVTAVANSSIVTITFTPPASDGGAPIQFYTVTSAPDGITATGAASPILVTGLTPGTAYTFTVTATNVIGTGPASEPSNSVTPLDVPSAPTAVSAVTGNGQVTVSFVEPASNGGSSILYYTVTSAPDGITATGAASPILVTGLTPGTAYTFTVTATNAVGTGPASAPSNNVTTLDVPSAPTAVTAIAGYAQATVSFTAPASDGGTPITLYTVTSIPDGMTATGTASPIVITGLAKGAAYTFTVTATNAVGTGPASAPSNSIVTILTVPAAPTNLAASAVPGSGVAIVTLTWTDNADNETGFTVQRATNNTFSQGLTSFGVAANAAGGLTTYIDNTAAPNTRYFYRVRARNAAGTSAWSVRATLVTPAAAPAAPSNLRVQSFNKNSITIRYRDNSVNEQGFYIERSTAGPDGPWTRIGTMGPNVTTVKNINLARRTTYWYRVQAYNANGVSAYSNVVSGTTN